MHFCCYPVAKIKSHLDYIANIQCVIIKMVHFVEKKTKEIIAKL
jgi:hypothetical protein